MKYFYALLFLLLISCGDPDEEELVEVDKGYDYFPLQEGLFREYTVLKETYRVGTIDTSFYFLREELHELVNGGDEKQQLISRYKRADSLAAWQFDSTWKQAKNDFNAFSIENGVRFNRLEFPLFKGKKWNFNAYNIKEEQIAELTILGAAQQSFEEICKVRVDSFFTLVNRDYAYEVYAKNVGLIEQHREYLNHQPKADTTGYRYHQQLIRYGKK